MDWAGWALFGVIATSTLTGVMIAAQLAGLTRLDQPLVLGTLVTADPHRARVAGFFIHLTADDPAAPAIRDVHGQRTFLSGQAGGSGPARGEP